MRFKVFGPFKIPLHEGKSAAWIKPPEIKIFWEKVNSKERGLPEACGVYVFGMLGDEKRRKGVASKTLPWYVGKAEKQTFKKECLTHRNRNLYTEVINITYNEKGQPFMFFLARMEDDNRTFSSPTTEEYPGVAFVEKYIIQNAMAVNGNIYFSLDNQSKL